MPRTFLAILLLAGCGVSEDRFLVEGVDAFCAAIATCTGHVPTEGCVDTVRAADRQGCDYDPKAADDCLAALEAPTCVLHEGTGRTSLDVPEACASVWPDCALTWSEPYEPMF